VALLGIVMRYCPSRRSSPASLLIIKLRETLGFLVERNLLSNTIQHLTVTHCNLPRKDEMLNSITESNRGIPHCVNQRASERVFLLGFSRPVETNQPSIPANISHYLASRSLPYPN
jgi:hypothetical protein